MMGREGKDGDRNNTSTVSNGSDLIKWSSPIRPSKLQPYLNLNRKPLPPVPPIPVLIAEELVAAAAAATANCNQDKPPTTSPLNSRYPPRKELLGEEVEETVPAGKENEDESNEGKDGEGGGEGILEQAIPDDMSEFSESEDFNRMMELEEECMLEDEDYYASLFFRCDSLGSGKAKVTDLLQSLKELQALGVEASGVDNSFKSVGSSIEDLEGLRSVLDPQGEDIQISLSKFREGIANYLWIKQWSIESPVKSVPGIMQEPGGGPRSSSPRRREHGFVGGRRLFNPNVSQISAEDGGEKVMAREECSSLEAFAGSSTTAGSSVEGKRDFDAEINDWELRTQKLSKDNVDLKGRLKEALQENAIVLEAKETQQRDFEVTSRIQKARMQRLEAEILQKNGTIASFEDRVVTLNHSQARLENQLSTLMKNNKSLMTENAELKDDVKKKEFAINTKDSVISNLRLKVEHMSTPRQWEEKELILRMENELLTRSVEELDNKVQVLESERMELVNTIKELKNSQDGRSPSVRRIAEASFDLDVSGELNDIQTELLIAAGDAQFPSRAQSTLGNTIYCMERFDVAVQCEKVPMLDGSVECKLLSETVDSNLLHKLMALSREITELLGEYRQGSVASVPSPSVAGESNPQVNGSNGAPVKTSTDEQNMNTVVREIHEELLDFRNQLKKSQELLNFISMKSSQSLSITKSCPGLVLDSSLNGGELNRVSIATQTDSPEVETPVLTQKLNLISPILSDSAESQASFDKLSDDGSVRVRDDLSIVLELSEQEADGNCLDTNGDIMNSERGSLGGSRPKLMRMANAAEEEGQTDRNKDREDDYVSVTSSQGESVYLSLERPLKVTISGKGEEDRSSSGAYRSCHSSLILGGSLGRGRIPHADSDTASIVSEGNTTFGSPFSSPSSPYWTPSQGSSSQETLTPLDGDRTPVNNEDDEIRRSPSGERSGSASFHSPTGRIPESKMSTMLSLAFDGPLRSVSEYGKLLNKEDWRELRADVDRRVRDEYNHAFAQEVGNEDAEGAVGPGVEGTGPFSSPQYAFRHDEEAEAYLELIPNLAEKLFNCFDVLRDKRDSISNEDLLDLERKFNHLAEVFQTEHTNLDQRIALLTSNLKESQESLKSMSSSLKSCLMTITEFSRRNGPEGPGEGLLEIVNSLSNMSEEFDLYSTSMCRDARRLGMMDVQNRLHRMMEVMILYVHMLKARQDQQSEEYRMLNDSFRKATDLLEQNKISFRVTADGGSGTQSINNNDIKKPLWDGSEMEGVEGTGCNTDGLSSGFRWILHLLGPTRPNNGQHPTPGNLAPKKPVSRNGIIRFVTELWDVFRWDLFWPWNTEKTMKGLKEAFAVLLMIMAVFAIFWRFFPYANAVETTGCSNLGYFKSTQNFFSWCGNLNHDEPPIV